MDKPSSASGRKPRALFLSAEPPYPVIGGGPIRSASLLEYLARHFSVHAIVFREKGTADPARAIPPGVVDRLDLIELPYHSRHPIPRLIRTAWRLARNRPPLCDRYSGYSAQVAALVSGQEYEVAVLEHFWCAPYVAQLRPHAKRVSLDLHNIESAWHSSMAAAESPLPAAGFRRFAKACAALERAWLDKFDSLLVTSCDDAKLARASVAEADVQVVVYPNGLPEIALPDREERPEIIFSGNLRYPPNVAAVQFFLRRVWPALRSRWPKLKWKILSGDPRFVQKLVAGDSRIELTGFVTDAVPVLAGAQVAVVPILAGSGTRIKILEAWAAGTPVVSTTLGAAGLDCRDQEHLLLADDPDTFAAAVSRLLASPEDRARIGMAGRRLYESRYTWPAAWETLGTILGNTPTPDRSNL